MTILEVLQNAEYNLRKGIRPLGLEQLHNALTLLDKGYDSWDEFEEVLEGYKRVEDVPEKEE